MPQVSPQLRDLGGPADRLLELSALANQSLKIVHEFIKFIFIIDASEPVRLWDIRNAALPMLVERC